MQVIIMRGIPGSGKTTYVKKNYPDAVVCSSDHFFTDKKGNYKFNMSQIGIAHQRSKEKFFDALKRKEPLVIVDNTNTRWREMEDYVYDAEEYGYDIVFIRLVADVETAHKRNIHNTPKEIVEKFNMIFEELPKEYAKKEIIIDEGWHNKEVKKDG
jgi:predicted kinase